MKWKEVERLRRIAGMLFLTAPSSPSPSLSLVRDKWVRRGGGGGKKKGEGGMVGRGRVRQSGRLPPGRCAPGNPPGEHPLCAWSDLAKRLPRSSGP